jgi:hydroxyacylglutathione hydrolase
MIVNTIPCLNDNYSYCLLSSNNQDACIVDPGEFEPIDLFLTKKKLNLKYILNTHHHSDHVGGNLQLKNKYNCKIAGYKPDRNRIPGIDIFLNDKQLWNCLDYEINIEHVPGHTNGHIFFYIKKEKIIFVGDTLFSMGCGRIFEGTYEDMYKSINKIKNLPHDTKIYCGHEYTLSNLKFCQSIDSDNNSLKIKTRDVLEKRALNQPTIPTTIKSELLTNIFFRLDDHNIRKAISLENATELEVFTKLRKLKDNF